jgi:serine/threonine protein kinase/tetratricopeptide (TPR) repeat protein
MNHPITPDPADRPSPESESVQPIIFDFSEETSKSQETFVPGALTGPAIPRPGLSPAAPPPAAFGRYEVRKRLGEGAFGAVYLGHDTQLDRPVAIKVFRGGSDVPAAEADRLMREARRLARLRHAGIVAVHDVGTQDGQVFIVSDYLDGEDLARWLKRHSPTWQQTAVIVAAVAEALAHAHAQLTIHRDVKPANILMTSDGNPVLVDFGLALDDASAGAAELGVIAGTPTYMAPEQVAGKAHRIDGRTDIYSLGVVLYEVLSGRVPFRADKSEELMRQVRDDEPQPLRQLARDVPPELERICHKALSKKMQDRYTTAADLAADLRRVIASTTDAPSAPSFHRSSTDLPSVSVSVAHNASSVVPSILSSSRRRVREAERRQVTVLVCASELFESDAYLEIVDPEDQAQALQSFGEICQQTAVEFGGTVVQVNEQGFLACFGYPIAFEDAARRAARAGLRMLERLQQLGEQFRRECAVDLDPWVGIHTGPAVVEAKDAGITLVGEARNVALRLANVAAGGHVICTEETQRLFRGRFRCVELGERKLKGVAQAVRLYRVEGIASAGSLVEASASAGLSPLTGRDHEMSLLTDRWEQAQEGIGQVVLLVGEPGLGKSRLVYDLKEHVAGAVADSEKEPPIIEWRCSPHFQNTELYPAIDYFERTLEFANDDSGEARCQRLVDGLKRYDLARQETVPLWASLLSLPSTAQYPSLALSPARQREGTFAALIEFLQARAARQPLLLIVEDLHWVDASTVEFLAQFIAETEHDPILTVLTFRPEFKAPWPAVAHQTSLALNRLTRRQAADLMRKKSGGALADAVIDQVYDRTGGVPLFVEEFTKMVQESGALARNQATSAAAALPAHEIPATLQDLVNARLDRMEGEQEIAHLAATLGREFSHEMIAAAAGMNEASLDAELEKLVRAEILFQKGRPPSCTYTFKHALLEDALYNAMVKSKRQELHRRVAQALEARFPQSVEHRPELLAHHFSEAGQNEKAVGYWLQAGLRSRHRSADVEAIGHLTKGLERLTTLGESPERDQQEFQFLTALGPAYIAVRGYAAPEVGPILQRARALSERLGDAERPFGIMLGLWEWRLVRGEIRSAADLANDGLALAESRNEPGLLMEALFMQAATRFYQGQFAEARRAHEQAIAAFDDRERTMFWTAFSGHNAGVTHRNYLSLALWHLGDPELARNVDREARELARTIGHAFSLGHALDFTGFLAYYCRLPTELLAAAEEETALGVEQGFELWQALGTIHKGAGLLLKGQPSEALPVILSGLGAFRATGAELRLPTYLGLLADAYLQSSRFDEAQQALDEGLAIAEKNDDRSHEAELYRLKGELALAAGLEASGAEACFLRALEMARQQESRGWELRAAASLARLFKQLGRIDEARGILAPVLETFMDASATPDLTEAAGLLKSLEI